MTNGKGEDRLDRVERVLQEVTTILAATQQQHHATMQEVDARLQYMAARQQYHDEAFDRMDTQLRELKEVIAVDSENIRALARIAEIHNRRLTDLEGGEPQ